MITILSNKLIEAYADAEYRMWWGFMPYHVCYKRAKLRVLRDVLR